MTTRTELTRGPAPTDAGRKSLAHLAEATLADLVVLRDRLKLKAHLAGMEAGKAWDEDLLPRLDALEDRLRADLAHLGDGTPLEGEVQLKLHLGLMEVREQWRTLEPRVAALLDRAHLLSHRHGEPKEPVSLAARIAAAKGSVELAAHRALDELREAIGRLRAGD